MLDQSEGEPGKQVTTTGVGPGNISLVTSFQKFEFEKCGYFGTTKENYSETNTQVTPGNAQVTLQATPSNTR